MCGFWSICCFSLMTQYQQHNLQGLCNKSFSPSIASFGSVVLLPGGAQEAPSQPVAGSSPEPRRGAESETGHGGLQGAGSAVQPRVPGVALVDERGARSGGGAAPRRGPRGSTTLTAAGGVGGPGAVGSGRGRISQRARRRNRTEK